MSVIDLRSDTVTRPTAAMREAMARAEVGDDVFGEDPLVNALQERCAEILGKEAALFVPSGTMANLLAVLSQTRPGDSVLLHEDAHPYNYESGNLGMVAGVQTRSVPGPLGIMDPADVAARIVQNPDHHYSPTTLIAVENTTNRGGGAIYPLNALKAIGQEARARGLRVHCDGARLFNAVVETGIPASAWAEHADTVSFCFSKGLGAPVGSILAGDAPTIDRAHRFRKMLGGGMRQAGVLAAAALHALDHHIDRLREDHRRAREFRRQLEGMPGLAFPLPSPTNIVYVEVPDAAAAVARLREEGVLVLGVSPDRIRVVFHLDVDDSGLEKAVDAFRRIASETRKSHISAQRS
jgi:threonine aldolase